eukprot:COSAG05_NODE_242_length_13038_cov_60.915140_5_plen_185_part_00
MRSIKYAPEFAHETIRTGALVHLPRYYTSSSRLEASHAKIRRDPPAESDQYLATKLVGANLSVGAVQRQPVINQDEDTPSNEPGSKKSFLSAQKSLIFDCRSHALACMPGGVTCESMLSVCEPRSVVGQLLLVSPVPLCTHSRCERPRSALHPTCLFSPPFYACESIHARGCPFDSCAHMPMLQ